LDAPAVPSTPAMPLPWSRPTTRTWSARWRRSWTSRWSTKNLMDSITPHPPRTVRLRHPDPRDALPPPRMRQGDQPAGRRLVPLPAAASGRNSREEERSKSSKMYPGAPGPGRDSLRRIDYPVKIIVCSFIENNVNNDDHWPIFIRLPEDFPEILHP
jgi:hypothetical protein